MPVSTTSFERGCQPALEALEALRTLRKEKEEEPETGRYTKWEIEGGASPRGTQS